MNNDFIIQRQLAHISIFLAAFIIGLHAFLPHVHGGAAPQVLTISQTEEGSTELLELLGNIFELDLGEGHLEHLTPDNESSWDGNFTLPLLLPPVAPTSFYAERIGTYSVAINYPEEEDLLVDLHHSSPADLRGPPFVV